MSLPTAPSPGPPGRGADPPEPDPVELVPLDPRVRTAWRVRAGAVLLQVTAVLAVLDGFTPLLSRVPDGLIPGAVLVLGAVLAWLLTDLRYRRWRYAVRPDDLWLRQGVLWTTVTVIPLTRLQFVDTRQGPLERLLGLASLVVHTAALGTSGRLPGLDAAAAEHLRERLARVQEDDAGV